MIVSVGMIIKANNKETFQQNDDDIDAFQLAKFYFRDIYFQIPKKRTEKRLLTRSISARAVLSEKVDPNPVGKCVKKYINRNLDQDPLSQMSESTIISQLKYACIPLQIRTLSIVSGFVPGIINVTVERNHNLWQFMLCNNLYVEFDLTNNKRSTPFICTSAQNISMTNTRDDPINLIFVPIINQRADPKIRLEFGSTNTIPTISLLNNGGYLNVFAYYAERNSKNLTGLGIEVASLNNKIVPASEQNYTIFNNAKAFTEMYGNDNDFMKVCSSIYDNFMMPTFTINFSFALQQGNVISKLFGLYIQDAKRKRLNMFDISVNKSKSDGFNIIIDSFYGQGVKPMQFFIPCKNPSSIFNVIATISAAEKIIFIEWDDHNTDNPKKIGYGKNALAINQGNATNMVKWWTFPNERQNYSDPTLFLYTNGRFVKKINSFSLGYGDMITPYKNRNVRW